MLRTIKNFTTYLAFALFISFLFTNCGQEQRAKPMAASIRNYVYAYTSGIVSKANPIRVRFNSQVTTVEKVGTEAPNHLFSLSPSVDGKLRWADEFTLEFTPSTLLKSGTVYVAAIKLNQLFTNVPAEAGTFEFDFRTKDQGYFVHLEGLQAENGQNLSKQVLNGKISTYDIADNAATEKLLSVKQSNNNLKIEWEHAPNGTEHRFSIKEIVRTQQNSEVQLAWNGSPLGISNKGNRTVEVPSLDDFKVTDAKVIQENGNYILLHFSDPILQGQNLEGLITISNYNKKLDFVVDGNNVRVYPEGKLGSTRTINVQPGIRNINNTKMDKASLWNVIFEIQPPAVRTVGRGVIMPNSEGLVFPFEAVSLDAVVVEVFKIYDNNILQFLQSNNMDGMYDLERVGRVVLQEKVNLHNLNPDAVTSTWTRYALDLSALFKQDPNAIYQIRLGFRPEYSSYFCGGPQVYNEPNMELMDAAPTLDRNGDILSFWGGWYGINGRYAGYEWEHRNDPCQPAYYNYERFVRSNLIASDLGITAKGGKDGSYFVAIADLRSTKSIPEATIEFFDYQQQLIHRTATNSIGIAQVNLERKPFICVATYGKQKGYLKLMDGNALSLSRYDVSGQVAQKGLKGFIYGDRGVWRPGDSLYLNFILEDKNNKLPNDHPITFELFDPRGQLQHKRTTSANIEQVYPLYVATSQDAPTGDWMAKVKAGGATFDKVLKIETVKPNRLKIDLDFGKETLSAADEPLTPNLQVNWLHGAPAQNLNTKVEVQVSQLNTTFENYNNYEFDDPSRGLDSEPVTIFDGTVDVNGQTTFTTRLLNNNANAPGKLKASFRTRAFEKRGDFSTDNRSMEYSPYTAYAGIQLPINKYKQKRIDIDKEGTLKFVVLDENGNPIKNSRISVGLYRIEWRWWWDRGWDNLSHYNQSNHYNAQETTVLTTNAKGEATWSVTVSEWGRYLVRACDETSGHCSGDFFYAGYPWYGNDNANRKEAAMMAFSSSKSNYQTGENIELNVPAGESGRVLITLETGTKVIESRWEEATKGENTFKFKATPEMSPTVYAHVSLIQPHAQADNDLPIRMYGVVPIAVEDPKTILKPTLKMPDELNPETKFTVEIAEEKGKPMAYTIAVVDEGLLDLTNFNTPDPHAALYAREALGVQTWDIYDHVLGAYGGELERILSIGGDGELENSADKKNANRFKPVVMHLGPFHLEKGRKVKHEITMPNYIGSVRAMVVAANSTGAYGHIDKTIPVRKPLMILATLPRVLGPTETLQMPVSVFAMDKKVKNVTISVEETSGLVSLEGGNSKSLTFNRPGEEMIYFNLKVNENVGIAKFKITAKGGGETTTQMIELDVRNPNPYVTNVYAGMLKAGETWEQSFEAVGMNGTNYGILEVTNLPPINLGERLQYLLRYPHGCIEQTTSSGFPQLYVDQLLDLTEDQKKKANRNIAATLNRLKRFQTAEGGFSYWPGDEDPNAWGSNYGGHFMLEAKAKGYLLPPGMETRWVSFQQKRARQWTNESGGFDDHGSYNSNDLMQAYRLYTLAVAGSPEMGAMNRMREQEEISLQAKWRLAAAYAVMGKPEVANQLIKDEPTQIEDYHELSHTYGSSLRDEGMILETLTLLKDENNSSLVAKRITDEMNKDQWLSTQTTAYCLLGMSKYIGTRPSEERLAFDYQVSNNKVVHAGSQTPIMQIQVPVDAITNKMVNVKNTTGGILYARLILTGQPIIGDQTAASENLQMDIVYKTTTGNSLDPASIPQGTDFVAEVTIINPGTRGMGYEEMALTQVFPSGWEILNARMSDFNTFANTTRPEYQDIRDDRIYTYFDINRNAKQVYRVQLNAAYQGRYYLPTVGCEAMYDNTINARIPGRWVEVIVPGNI